MKEKKKLTIGGIFSQIVLLILAVIVLYPLAFIQSGCFDEPFWHYDL